MQKKLREALLSIQNRIICYICRLFIIIIEQYMNQMPPITKNLLIINVLFYLATIVGTKYGVDLENILGLHFFKASDFHLYQLVSYMFMHGSFAHIFFNMFALWMFGGTLEYAFGPKRFLIYYFVCGIGAALIQEGVQYVDFLTTLSHYQTVNTGTAVIPMEEYLNMLNTVGASGAIYGILLAFGVLFPNQSLFIFPLPFPIKAKYFIMVYIVLELVLGITGGDGVAHFAHLGGMLFGFLLILFWRRKKKYNGTYYN